MIFVTIFLPHLSCVGTQIGIIEAIIVSTTKYALVKIFVNTLCWFDTIFMTQSSWNCLSL